MSCATSGCSHVSDKKKKRSPKKKVSQKNRNNQEKQVSAWDLKIKSPYFLFIISRTPGVGRSEVYIFVFILNSHEQHDISIIECTPQVFYGISKACGWGSCSLDPWSSTAAHLPHTQRCTPGSRLFYLDDCWSSTPSCAPQTSQPETCIFSGGTWLNCRSREQILWSKCNQILQSTEGRTSLTLPLNTWKSCNKKAITKWSNILHWPELNRSQIARAIPELWAH